MKTNRTACSRDLDNAATRLAHAQECEALACAAYATYGMPTMHGPSSADLSPLEQRPAPPQGGRGFRRMTRRKLASFSAAVIYLRVSTDGQRVSGLGREAQEAACREHCARHGWTVQAVHCDDGLSGTLPVEERPGLAAAVEAARASGVVLLVYSVSRAARSVGELYRLVEPRDGSDPIPLVSVSEPFDLTTAMGKAFLGMLAVLAALESDLASERTIAALAAAKARGVKLGAPKVLDAAHPGVVRARELRAGGMSERDIVDTLNHERVPAARGGKWYQKTVRAALAA